MKAFFSSRADGASSRRRHDRGASGNNGHDNNRGDIFYPTTATSSTNAPPPPSAYKSTKKSRKFSIHSIGSTKSSRDSSWTDLGGQSYGSSFVAHGPASSSSASGPNAADIGSVPVTTSMRSKPSNGSFSTHAANRTSAIGTLLGGFNSASSLSKNDDGTGRRSSARSNSLAALFNKSANSPGTTDSAAASSSSPHSRSSRAKKTGSIASGQVGSYDHSSDSALSGFDLVPTRRDSRLTRQGSIKSHASRASIGSDNLQSQDSGSFSLGTVRNIFRDRQRPPSASASHAPSSYYDPTTSTRTKRRGITPNLDSRNSASWSGMKEAADVHPEVFIVSNDSGSNQTAPSIAPGSARTSPSQQASPTFASTNKSPVPSQELEGEPTPRPDHANGRFEPSSLQVQQNSKRDSTLSTRTIQPPPNSELATDAADPATPKPHQDSTMRQPLAPENNPSSSASSSKTSLSKRLSGTLRPRKSLSMFLGNGRDIADEKDKRKSRNLVGDDDSSRSGAENDDVLVRRSSTKSTHAASVLRQSVSGSSPSLSRASSIVSGKTSNTNPLTREQQSHGTTVTTPPNSYDRYKGLPHGDRTTSSSSALSPQDFALQLNELAVSHADGLLSDEEYRLLRQALFEQHMSGGSSVGIPASARLSSPDSHPAVSPADSQNSSSYFRAMAGRDDETRTSTMRGAHDVGDRRSMGGASVAPSSNANTRRPLSVFRRVSQTSRSSDDGTNDHLDRSIPHDDGHLSSAPVARGVKSRSSTVSTSHTGSSSASSTGRSLHPTSASHHVRNGSRSVKSGSSSVTGMTMSSELREGSTSTQGGGGSTSLRRRLTSSTSAKSQQRAQELETEVRRRRAQRASSLLSADSGHSGPTIGGADVAGGSVVDHDHGSSIRERSSSAPHHPSEDGHSTSLANATLTANASRLDTQDVLYADKSSPEIEAELRVIESEGRKVLSAFESLESGLIKNIADENTWRQIEAQLPEKKELVSTTTMSPSTKNKRLSSTLALRSNKNRNSATETQMHSPTADSSNSKSSKSPIDFPSDRDGHTTASGIGSIQSQLVDVRTRRAAVVKRYEDRMAFLSSKARAARIREQLA